MSILKYEGTVTALSSIAHGAQSLGTITYLRRERFILSNNTQEDIPVISGNAWRGLLRDVAADLWWERVGSPKMTLAVVHALWSGGALAKVAGQTLTGSRLASIRKAVPVVGIFGTAGGGRIIDGCLQVGKMVPICKETSHIVPKEFQEKDLPSFWDITQIEYYSRNALTPKSIGENRKKEEDETFDPMRFGVETFIAGTRFYTWFALAHPSIDEKNFFFEALSAYLNAPKVGGMNKIGHGELLFDFPQLSEELSSFEPWGLSDGLKNDLLGMLAWLD